MKKSALNLVDRKASFTGLEAETFDVLVIGAGITGAGIAREAAMRGLRTAIIDAGDIASGTSSRSSKLIHGGLRYLAQGQVSVVREAANERRTLRKIAPHLAQTNPMVVLAQSKKYVAVLKTALWTYEKLGKVDKHERHENWQKNRLQQEEPAIDTRNLVGAVVYPEYLTDDTRLTLANARGAVAHGATVVTYAVADELLFENGQVIGAKVKGTLPTDNFSAVVKARTVINSAGPWVDIVRRMENSEAKSKLQLTKGIHLVFNRECLPINRSVVWNAPDGRGLFAVPRGRFAYIGTTDTFYADPTYHPEITKEDISYLLDSANEVFKSKLTAERDVISLWSGLRPLLGTEGKKPSEISRRDEVMEGTGGVSAIAGGKLTSYRSMAKRLVDQCEKKLGKKPSHASTDDEALPGGDFTEPIEELRQKVEKLGLSTVDAERVTRLYGSEALEIFANGSGPAVEAVFAVACEGALTLEDYWIRRSSRGYFDDKGGMESLKPAADAMAKLLNWSDEARDQQIEFCRRQREADMKILK